MAINRRMAVEYRLIERLPGPVAEIEPLHGPLHRGLERLELRRHISEQTALGADPHLIPDQLREGWMVSRTSPA